MSWIVCPLTHKLTNKKFRGDFDSRMKAVLLCLCLNGVLGIIALHIPFHIVEMDNMMIVGGEAVLAAVAFHVNFGEKFCLPLVAIMGGKTSE